MKAKIANDVTSFEKGVERAERYRFRNADDQHRVSHATKILTPSNFPIHSVNMGENHDFIGREKELGNLHDTLVRSHVTATPVSCVIHGIGGVGKTQFALKFLYKYRSDFRAVFWISADPEKETEILRTFGAIGRKLRLFDSEDIDQTKVEIIVDWLETTGTFKSIHTCIYYANFDTSRTTLALGLRQRRRLEQCFTLLANKIRSPKRHHCHLAKSRYLDRSKNISGAPGCSCRFRTSPLSAALDKRG